MTDRVKEIVTKIETNYDLTQKLDQELDRITQLATSTVHEVKETLVNISNTLQETIERLRNEAVALTTELLTILKTESEDA